MRDRRLRVVLEIVRRQPVLVRADEGLEEQPGAPSDETQCSDVAFGELGRLGDGARKADLASNPRCREPQHDERRGDPPCVRLEGDDQQGGDGGDHDTASHLPVEAADVEIAVGFHLSGGLPLEQMAAGEDQAGERAHDRIDHDPRLVSEEGDLQDHLGCCDHRVADRRRARGSLGDAATARDQAGDHRQRGGTSTERRPGRSTMQPMRRGSSRPRRAWPAPAGR